MGIFDNFNSHKDEMSEEEKNDFTDKLIKIALEGKHNKLDFIRNPNELKVVRTLKKANKDLAKGFRRAADVFYNDYVNGLKVGIDNLQLLFNYRTFRKCTNYFTEEAELADDRLSEYWTYLSYGHFIDNFILFQDRLDEEMYDHRVGRL